MCGSLLLPSLLPALFDLYSLVCGIPAMRSHPTPDLVWASSFHHGRTLSLAVIDNDNDDDRRQHQLRRPTTAANTSASCGTGERQRVLLQHEEAQDETSLLLLQHEGMDMTKTFPSPSSSLDVPQWGPWPHTVCNTLHANNLLEHLTSFDSTPPTSASSISVGGSSALSTTIALQTANYLAALAT